MYAIGEFSRATGIPASTLRYYEDLGLLSPARDSSGHRRYDESDIMWAQFLRRLQDTGMPLAQIKAYSDLRKRGEETLEERLHMLQAHRAALKDRMRALASNFAKLDDKIEWYKEQIKCLGDEVSS